jgi:hypothetical protein
MRIAAAASETNDCEALAAELKKRPVFIDKKH